jgi:hypothetical protein
LRVAGARVIRGVVVAIACDLSILQSGSAKCRHGELSAKKESRDGSSRHEGLGLLPLEGKRKADGEAGLVRWEKKAARSDRQRDLPGPLEPADGLASPPIRHASVDEARLDVSMAKVILYEVDRLGCVEKMRRHRVTHRVHVLRLGGRLARVA